MEKEKRELFEQFQNFQKQLQTLIIQKESLRLQTIEIENALKELNTTKQKEAFKITGNIMVKKSVDELKKELEERKENISIRIKSLEKTEERISNKIKELQNKLK